MAWTHLSVTRVRKWASDWIITFADSIRDLVITSAADANIIQYNGTNWVNDTKLRLQEIADPGFATADEAWLHAEDVAGITQVHHNTSGHKWVIGQDNWIVCRNVTGADIPVLRAVYVSGSTGARPQITMADADLHEHAIGITQDTIATNGYGAVVISGYVKGVDTSGWVAGDALYLSSTAGVLTTTAPAFPAAKQRLATVIYSHATQGIVQVFHHEDVREGDGTWESVFQIGDGSTAGELRLLEPSGTQYTAIKTQAQTANVTYTLPAADATVSGYGLTSNASGTLSWSAVTPTLGTIQASTSGTTIDFTGIPAGVKEIVIMLDGVSTNGTASLALQLGDAGGIETTGYRTNFVYGTTAASPSYSSSDTTLFIFGVRGNADNTHTSTLRLTLMDAATNTWILDSQDGGNGTTPYYCNGTGRKALSATLDRVRILANGGVDTFDAGNINILYE